MLGYQKENKVRSLTEFGVNLISNTFCALEYIVLSNKQFDNSLKLAAQRMEENCKGLKTTNEILSVFS